MIPKKLYSYTGDRGGRVDQSVDEALKRIDEQFQQFHLAATRVAFGEIINSRKLQNLEAYWIIHTFGGVANTDEQVNHPLGVVPRGLINVETPLFQGLAPLVGTVSFGAVAPTPTAVTVRCTIAAKVATFILIP